MVSQIRSRGMIQGISIVLYLIITLMILLQFSYINYFFDFLTWEKMMTFECHQSWLLAKSLSNPANILLAQICSIYSLTMSILRFFVLELSFFTKLSICQVQDIKYKSWKIVAVGKMASTIQIDFWSRSFCCYNLLAFNARRH